MNLKVEAFERDFFCESLATQANLLAEGLDASMKAEDLVTAEAQALDLYVALDLKRRITEVPETPVPAMRPRPKKKPAAKKKPVAKEKPSAKK